MLPDARKVCWWSLCWLGASLLPTASAMDLAASGSWSTTINASDLQAGAGSPLVATHDSATAQVVLTVSATAGSTDAWRLDVRRADSAWDPDVKLWVRRTGAGSGAGSISDGLSWIEVGPTDTSFFSGAGDRSDVPVQLRISGVSLSLSPDSYLSTVHYTLVDTL